MEAISEKSRVKGAVALGQEARTSPKQCMGLGASAYPVRSLNRPLGKVTAWPNLGPSFPRSPHVQLSPLTGFPPFPRCPAKREEGGFLRCEQTRSRGGGKFRRGFPRALLLFQCVLAPHARPRRDASSVRETPRNIPDWHEPRLRRLERFRQHCRQRRRQLRVERLCELERIRDSCFVCAFQVARFTR